MNISNIVIVPKMSKYELDMYIYKLTPGELLVKYKQEGVDEKRILESHERQKQSLKELKRFFGEKQFVPRDELTREIAAKADMVIALGGDNHFQYVSHFLDNSGLIMGINSDPLRSEGNLIYLTTSDFENVLKKMQQGDFYMERWTRLEVQLNGEVLELATSELFLGEKERKYMSRHILTIRERTEEQKSSGLLVATGAGSTGWYDSACRYLYPDGNWFSGTAGIARFLVTEPFHGKLSGYSVLEGVLEAGDELIVRSLNDSAGILSIDSLEEYEFNRGASASIQISDKPLRVVRVER